MDNYLSLIRKADFADLFKYGFFHLNSEFVCKFTCDVTDLHKDNAVFEKLTRNANSFDNTFAYIFIHFVKDSGDPYDLYISEVQNVFALDHEAKAELSISLDPRIQIQDPIWPSATFHLQKSQLLKDCVTGAENIWRIVGLNDSLLKMEEFIPKSNIEEVVDEIFADRHPSGDLPIWVYLMRYKRHDFYPQNTIGSFMDSFHVIFNFMQKRELDGAEIENTNIMQFLFRLNETSPNLQFVEIQKQLQDEPAVERILTEIKKIESRFDLLKASALFFVYKDKNEECFGYNKDLFEYGKQFGIEFSIAMYMLGLLLGHVNTCDCLYDELPLPIFKKQLQCTPEQKGQFDRNEAVEEDSTADSNGLLNSIEKTENKENETLESNCGEKNMKGELSSASIPVISSDEKTNEGDLSLLFEYEAGEEPLQNPIEMKKSARAKKDVVFAHTRQEYEYYCSKGYKHFPKNKSKK